MSEESMHWADQTARKIIKVKKDQYVCASGITPSGIVHIGNFREIITVELVVRALKDLGKKTRFIYSWDDYDVFRKVPKGWPKQDELKKELRKPIVDVPDPYDKEESFARHNEVAVEKELSKLGINPEFIYQSKQYRKCAYKEGMRKALEHSKEIKSILDNYRKEPLSDSWLPISIFDPDTKTDEISDIKYLGNFEISYKDKNNKEKTFDFSKDGISKLLWRIDWPMRWAYEKVDFEPGGKDHSTEGGSFTTAKEIVKKIYNQDPPLYIMYDFISIKGAGGKISSSLGNVITIKDVLEIYEPDIVRYLFAGTRPNTEFAISFDLDVIKIYEDFDKLERIYYDKEDLPEKEASKQKRIYELSCVDKPKKKFPLQPSFRHLCNIIQIYENDFDKIKDYYKKEIKEDFDSERLKLRVRCASNWINNYAPEAMRFNIVKKVGSDLNEKEKNILTQLKDKLKEKDYTEDELFNEFYGIIKSNDYSTKDFFKLCYRILINKEKGPKLAPFILTIGKEKVIRLLDQV
ncbi:MAG: lysine--tRNA ligase [Nanoarchaeota archaeon]|nr:lysine--tRNA ligase [Nanoarchaeota archaeon]